MIGQVSLPTSDGTQMPLAITGGPNNTIWFTESVPNSGGSGFTSSAVGVIDVKTSGPRLVSMTKESFTFWAFGLFGFVYFWIDAIMLSLMTPSHALGWLMRNGSSIDRDAIVIANLSGRGDKDVPQVAALESR